MPRFTRVPHAPTQDTFVVDVRGPDEDTPRYLLVQDLNTAQIDYFTYTRKFGPAKEGGVVYNYGGRPVAYISHDGKLWMVDRGGRPMRAIRTLRQAYNAVPRDEPGSPVRDNTVQQARSRFDVGDRKRYDIKFDTRGMPDRERMIQLRRLYRSLADNPAALLKWKDSIAELNDREFERDTADRMDRMASMDPKQLASQLAHFTGSESVARMGFPPVLATDGVQFLCENASCYWLVDVIASHQTSRQVAAEEFQVWTLTLSKSGSGAVIVADDGNGRKIASQRIPYTDFPLPKIKLFVQRSPGQSPVVMLPSEY